MQNKIDSKSKIKHLRQYLQNLSSSKIVYLIILVCIMVILSIVATDKNNILTLMLSQNLPFILHNTGLVLFLILLFRIFTFIFIDYEKNRQSKLKNKIVFIFTFITIISCTLITILAIAFINKSMQQWFNNNMSKTIKQAAKISEEYIRKHEEMLKQATLHYAKQIERQNITDELLEQKINENDLYGILTNAIVFSVNPAQVIAKTQTGISFFDISNIPYSQINNARDDYITVFNISKSTICAIAKIPNEKELYIALTQTLDKKSMEYIDKTVGTVNHYYYLKEQLNNIQIRFATIFIVIVTILTFTSITFGMIFARRITLPIINLVNSTKALQKGDFSKKVPLYEGNDEIATLSTAFNVMIEKLNKQQKAIALAQKEIVWSDLAKKVAHEINNPLTPIRLSSERLLKKLEDKDNNIEMFKKYLNNILSNVDNIKEIIASFSYFGKLPHTNKKSADIIQWMKNIVESRKIIKPYIKYEIYTKLNSLLVAFDAKQLLQAINNLLINSEENLDITNAKDKKISVEISTEQNKIEIILQDNGLGFDKVFLENDGITPYITTKKHGTGLGLTIAKKIIEDHDGTMHIKNATEDGITKGAMVIISLDK